MNSPAISNSTSLYAPNIARKSPPLNRVDVRIHVYDLLPTGKFSSFLWTVGGSLLHSGVAVGDKEYAYGGHDRKGVSGVYWTRPLMEPPGATFRCEILHGFALRSEEDIETIIRESSHRFLGPSWNLLDNNCNHFTSYLCQQLTGNVAPAWLNRAASLILRLPCVIPSAWLAPPDAEMADGELVEEEDYTTDDENLAMLRRNQRRPENNELTEMNGYNSDKTDEQTLYGNSLQDGPLDEHNSSPRLTKTGHSIGRAVPVSEWAP